MSNNNAKPEPLRIRLDNVRLSYPALDKPSSIKQADGTMSKPKFQLTVLLDKKAHKADIDKLNKLIERAQIDKFGKLVKLKNVCLKDGEEKEDTDGYGPDVMSLIAKNDNRPAVVDGAKNTVAPGDAKWPYAGCYVNVSVEIFAYKHQVGGYGVSASLRAVQFAKDGEPFGAGKVDVDEEFETVADSAEDY